MKYRNAEYNANGTIDAEIEHPKFGWIPCTLSRDDPDNSDIFDRIEREGGAKPVDEEKVLREEKIKKVARINQVAKEKVSHIRDAYPQFEIDTWPEQKEEAFSYQKDSSAETPMLSGIAEERGLSVAELVQRVLAKVESYRDAVSRVTGIRQRLEDEVQGADTTSQVEAIDWPESL